MTVKRIIIFALILVMLFATAYSESMSFSDKTVEELVYLRKTIDDELEARNSKIIYTDTYGFEDGTLYVFDDGNNEYGDIPWEKEKDRTISLEIQEGTQIISDFAFKGYSNLLHAIIPESVAIIGHSAFLQCDRLLSVEICKNVEYIGGYAFGGCGGLKSIIIPETVKYIGENAFWNTSDKFVIKCKKGSYADQYAAENSIPVEYE